MYQQDETAKQGGAGNEKEFHNYWNFEKDAWREVPEGDLPSVIASGQARFHTILSTTFRDGSPGAAYRGPFYLDVDVKEEQGGIAVATQATNRLADKLADKGVDLAQCRLFASGGKGYHIEVPSEIFRDGGDPATGTPALAAIYRDMADSIYVEGLDLAVYSGSKGRQWRIPNVDRGNGRYKVPITLAELRSMTPEGYAALTSSPRPAVATDQPTIAAGLALEFVNASQKVAAITKKKPKVKAVTRAELAAMTDTKQVIEIVKAEALARIGTLVPEWLEGSWHGTYFAAKNPNRPNDRKAGSFIVYRNGSWIEMASDIGKDGKHEDRGSDLVSLYAYTFGARSQEDAAHMLALKHDIDINAEQARLRVDARVAAVDARSDEGPEGSVGGFITMSAASLLSQEFKPAREIVKGLLFEGVTILCGPPKVGKSFLAMDIALSVAAGVPTLGGRLVNGGPVLYITPDDANRPRLQRRITDIASARHAGNGLERFSIVLDPPRVNEGFEEVFKRHIEAMPIKPVLAVIDTLNKAMPLGGRQSNQYQHESNVMGSIKKLADEYQVAILVLHHDRKAESADKLDGVSGTKAVTGGCDSIWMMRRLTSTSGMAASLDITGRDCEEMSLGLTFNKDALTWRDDGQTPEMLKAGESRQEVLNLLRLKGCEGASRRPEAPGLSVKQIAEALDEKPNSVRKLLDRMVNSGLLVDRASGKGTTYALP